jgi:regulator of sigma E protease
MVFILVALLVLGILIFVHELGHFAVAKLTGMPVDEFSLGFGPAIVSKQWGETRYSLRLLPLGGYNKIAGMEPGDDRPDGYSHKPLAARMGVILAGSLSNLVFAVLIFVLVFSVIGIPTPSNANVIGDILSKSPAETAGLKPGDRIVMIDGQKTSNWNELASAIHGQGVRPVTLLVERDGQDFSLAITPENDPNTGNSMIGIMPLTAWVMQGLVPSIQTGLQQSYGWLVQILQSLVLLFTGKAQMQDISGPVGIVQQLGDTARQGLRYLLLLTGVLGINLAIVNLLPIPALDGSRLVFLLLEGVRGKPINPEKEGIIHLVGFAVLMCLVLLITYNDIVRLFSGG